MKRQQSNQHAYGVLARHCSANSLAFQKLSNKKKEPNIKEMGEQTKPRLLYKFKNKKSIKCNTKVII